LTDLDRLLDGLAWAKQYLDAEPDSPIGPSQLRRLNKSIREASAALA
jgi:hypothetical protein